MRILAVLLVTVIVVPAIAVACHCCPPAVQDGSLVIQKAACQSCCGASEITLACGTLSEKPAVNMPGSYAAGISLPQMTAAFRAVETDRAVDFPVSPPARFTASLSVLRI